MKKFRVGIVGCGAISGAYLHTAPKFPILDIVACADLNPAAAQAKAKEFNVPRVMSVDELIASPDIDGVLNLTIPKAHAEVALKAIAAGKHVFSEKPLGINRQEGLDVLAAAKRKGVRVGNAPDTFLGSAAQTARRAIDQGLIGKPLAAMGLMLCGGHETWHPSPEFYYQPGGGPMFDMGPYYLHALINLFGPPVRVVGSAATLIPQRTITSQPKHGQRIDVQTPDHFAGNVLFANGVVATLIMSFATRVNPFTDPQSITVFGEKGTLRCFDPNGFDGDVLLRRVEDAAWSVVPNEHPTGYQRSAGLADMAHAIASNRPHRASAQMAMATLDAMQGFLDAQATGRAIDLHVLSAVDRPAAVPPTLPAGTYE